MAEAVLDSSAILAVILSERGAEQVADLMPESLVSVANEAEVITVLIRNGSPPEQALSAALELPYRRVDLDAELARRAGTLWRDVKPRGLSLGDRCCLALAERERLPVVTADQKWADLALDIEIRMFRSPAHDRGGGKPRRT
jgi:PIN domain nuclease of toxin-antitoxin system